MRIIKDYGNFPTQPCGMYGYAQAEDYTLVVGALSVDTNELQNLTFYPNPTQDQLNLKAESQIESVTVYNLLGQEIINLKPNSMQTQIDMNTLERGVYLMNVTLNGAEITHRIIKN